MTMNLRHDHGFSGVRDSLILRDAFLVARLRLSETYTMDAEAGRVLADILNGVLRVNAETGIRADRLAMIGAARFRAREAFRR